MELERHEDDEEEVVYCLLFGAGGVATENLLPSILTRLLSIAHLDLLTTCQLVYHLISLCYPLMYL
jgi:fumarate reductase subunit D